MYRFTNVFLFDKPNIRGNSCILTNPYAPTHLIMLSQMIFSVASGIFSVVSLIRFLAFLILSHCIFLLHHSQFMARHAQALHSKCQPQNKEAMLSTALGFPIRKRSTDHSSILVPEAVGFSSSCCDHEFNASRKEMPK